MPNLIPSLNSQFKLVGTFKHVLRRSLTLEDHYRQIVMKMLEKSEILCEIVIDCLQEWLQNYLIGTIRQLPKL